MGNTCKGILNKDANNEIQFENKKLCEKETKTVLRFMLDHIVAKRTQLDKNNISQQVTHIVNNFENITEDNMKNLKDFQQLFLELSRKSKEKFTKLNIEYYGIFDFESLLDRDDSILSFTKELITNYYCHLISENETLLSSYLKIDSSCRLKVTKPSVPSYLNTHPYNHESNMYRNIIKHYDYKNDSDSIINDFLVTENKQINRNFLNFLMKYYNLHLLHKGNYLNSKDKYFKINKLKTKELKNVIKERFIGDDIVDEDIQEKLDFINDSIPSKRKDKYLKEPNDILVSTASGTYDSFHNAMSDSNTKRSAGKQNLRDTTLIKEKVIDISKKNFVLDFQKMKEKDFSNFNNKSLNMNITSLKLDQTIKHNNSILKQTILKDIRINKLIPLIPKTMINKVKYESFSFYSGEIDSYNFQFMGIGKYFKPDLYFYKGTFIKGKKDGYGYMFKQEFNRSYSFYFGEWENNLPNGFGIAYIYPDDTSRHARKPTKILRGKFKDGKFSSGIDITITEDANHIMIEKFHGNIENDSFKSGDKLYRICYRIIDLVKEKMEIEYFYLYQGEFKYRSEHGKGISVKTYPKADYRYYYKGEFQHGLMNGEGTIIFEGNFFVKKYEGIFENDKWFCRYGKVYFRSGDIYEGFFDSSNCKNVLGMYIHSNRNINQDEIKNNDNIKNILEVNSFSENEFNALSILNTTENFGDSFFGEFCNDKKHGFGKYLYSSEKVLSIGRYLEGERNGKFETVMAEQVKGNVDTHHKKNFSKRKLEKIVKYSKTKKFYLIENDEIIDESETPFQN